MAKILSGHYPDTSYMKQPGVFVTKRFKLLLNLILRVYQILQPAYKLQRGKLYSKQSSSGWPCSEYHECANMSLIAIICILLHCFIHPITFRERNEHRTARVGTDKKHAPVWLPIWHDNHLMCGSVLNGSCKTWEMWGCVGEKKRLLLLGWPTYAVCFSRLSSTHLTPTGAISPWVLCVHWSVPFSMH